MKRGEFLRSSLLSASLGSFFTIAGNISKTRGKKVGRDFYELRVYTLKDQMQGKLVEDYFDHAAIPAFNKIGIKNIGVFREMKPEYPTRLFVIIPFRTIEEFENSEEKISRDPIYQKEAFAYLHAPAADPAYERIESSLLRAFAHMPNLKVPEKKHRMFELRRYESASEGASKKKIEMFNQAGEIDIFRKDQLTPVFFGETIIGSRRPNLTYMIVFEDMAEHDRNWKLFGADPSWKEISSLPEYADAKIVSRITSTFIMPTNFSQV